MVVTTRRAAAKQAKTTVNNNDHKSAKATKSKATKATADSLKTDPPFDDNEDKKIDGDEESNKEDSDEETSDEEEDDDSSEDDNSQDEDDDLNDSDDDLDELLKNAELSLRTQQFESIKLGDDTIQKATSLQLPKLDPGISIKDELYIKKGRVAKLSPQSVEVVDDAKAANNALVTLHKVKEEPKPLSRKERQLEREKTAGKGWFDMPLAEITPEVKRDLQILRMRHVLDRKRHYKKMGKGPDPKYFQMGTVIEGATEYFSSRLNKKDRKRTFAEELLTQDEHTAYYERKYLESQERRSAGGKKHYKKLKAKRS